MFILNFPFQLQYFASLPNKTGCNVSMLYFQLIYELKHSDACSKRRINLIDGFNFKLHPCFPHNIWHYSIVKPDTYICKLLNTTKSGNEYTHITKLKCYLHCLSHSDHSIHTIFSMLLKIYTTFKHNFSPSIRLHRTLRMSQLECMQKVSEVEIVTILYC